MSTRKARARQVQQHNDTATDHTEESDNNEDSQVYELSYNDSRRQTRRSKRLEKPVEAVTKKPQHKALEEVKATSKRDNSQLNVSVEDLRRQYKLLKQPIQEGFGYEVKEQDIYYLQDFFIELPKLRDTWKRIGFNRETQEGRLETLYEKLIDTFQEIIESEEELEGNILQSIEDQRLQINELCLELSLKPSELKLKKAKSMLEEDDILRAELRNLEAEKHKRLDEYNKLVIVENEFSSKLCIDPVEKRNTVPSQKMLNDLSARITELTQLCKKRKEEMSSLKEEIINLNEDLEMSRSDSFAEMIVMESIDEIPLGEDDLKRTREFRDDLRHKDNMMVNEIGSLRSKIRELWKKLNIGNEALNDMVMSDEFTDTKRAMISALREEHELCVQIKMENMQKFIESVRVEIREYCDKMFMGPRELQELENELLLSDDFTEEMLTRHEQKKEELEFKYAESQLMFEKAARWIKLWSDFIEFEEKTKDPARFKVRGYNMLAEEKQRKLFNSQLPKLEEDLAQHAYEYANSNDRKEFEIGGLFWSEYIQRKKQDHEQSKMNERKEKQIMRDNMKKNESRFGSKPITPLAIRNKRKMQLTTMGESTMVTPGRTNKNPKILKTDNTPGTSILAGSTRGVAGSKVSTRAGMQPKLNIASKRKSKTPAKNRFRKSRGLVAEANASHMNETVKSTASYQTINSTTNSSSVSRLGTSTMSTASNKFGYSRTATASKTSKPAATGPPKSLSSKYGKSAAASSSTPTVMHSTASGTFLEDENFEGIENVDITVRSTVSTKSTSRSKLGVPGANKFNFQHPDSSKYEKLGVNDINYSEFSRDLVKMQSDLKANMSRFGGSTLGDRTNSSTLSSRYGTRSGKAALGTRTQTEQEKLTSTLLSMN